MEGEGKRGKNREGEGDVGADNERNSNWNRLQVPRRRAARTE